MKKKYSTAQIKEAIAYWKNQLKKLDESDDMYNEYKSVCVKYGPKFKQALEMMQAFKTECPADATCIVDGIVDDFINTATEMDEWCEGTLQNSPNDYEY